MYCKGYKHRYDRVSGPDGLLKGKGCTVKVTNIDMTGLVAQMGC